MNAIRVVKVLPILYEHPVNHHKLTYPAGKSWFRLLFLDFLWHSPLGLREKVGVSFRQSILSVYPCALVRPPHRPSARPLVFYYVRGYNR